MNYFGDDDSTIGFFPVDLDPDKVLKKINIILESEFVGLESNHYDDVGAFEADTIVINANLFTDDLLDLIEYGIYIHIVDY